MSEERKRRGGSLVFPILLVALGLLLLLDNLGITPGIDWGTIWKLWPVILIAFGLEIILGRRVSFGAVVLVVLIIVIAGPAIWWSTVTGDGERRTEQITWPMDGVERAEIELKMGVGEFELDGEGDMADLMVADLNLAHRGGVSQDFQVDGDVARGWLNSEHKFFPLPNILGGKSTQWNLKLNSRVRWDITASTGVGDVAFDLSDLKVSDFKLDAGVGSVQVTMPERGSVRAQVNGGVGDIRITIPTRVQARIHVDRGLGNLDVGSRFKRRGDYYETENWDNAESYIDMQVDLGIGNVTIH